MSPTLLALWAASAAPVQAIDLDLEWEDALRDGVTVRHYRASDPGSDVFVALVDLCTEHVHVDATPPPDGYATTATWASDRGVQLATNGDFYTSGPQVYGDAVGSGVPWPTDQTGTESSGSWYHEKYGWIAFLHDEVTYTHTGWVKENLGPSTGWAPTDLTPEPPPGTIALVSGFPELVVDGEVYSCSSPTADDCFPDRSDMRARHPRTAMGLTEDRGTFILAVVDGRTSSNKGMYGAELAELMGELGAHVAFNLDGGGSSQFWTEDDSYLNDRSGNNYGSGSRSVANQWGVLAGSSSGSAARPGHCSTEPPCEALGPGGGTLDDTSECFALWGDPDYWRSVDQGHDGHLWWTNAWEHETAENWAWWRLELEEAGEYEVSVWLDPDYSVYEAVRYEVRAAGSSHEVILDQGAGTGWVSLGSYTFAAGGEQWVALYDNYDVDVASSQHIAADALKLERLGDWCGDGTCAEAEGCDCPEDCALDEEIPDNGVDDDCDGTTDDGGGSDEGGGSTGAGSGSADDSGAPDTADTGFQGQGQRKGPREPETGCTAVSPAGGGLLALLALVGRRRRRGGQGDLA